MIRILARALAMVLMAGPAMAAAGTPPPTVVYNHVTVIDGTGAAAKPDMAIVTRGARIVSVVPAADAPSSGEQIDMQGAYALPGLINTHVHMATSPNTPFAEALLRRDLYGGITAVRDMAGDTRELAFLSRAALLGETPSPDIYYAALMAGPAFFKDQRTHDAARGATPGAVPWMQAITPKTDLKIAVAEARGTSATGIKIYADLPARLVDRITAEAHRQHMLVWDHAAVFPASPRQVIDSGVDVASHVCMLAYQASDKIPRAYHNRANVQEEKFAGPTAIPAMADLFADMKKRGTILDATLYVYKVMWDVPDAKSAPYCTLSLAEKLAAQAHRAGVDISTGTDANAKWDAPFPALYDELALLVHHAGMTPLDAIRAATLVGARAIGQDKVMGTIASGKLANLMFVSEDPRVDIGNLKSVVLTVKRGRRYARKSYRPIARSETEGEF